MRNLRHRFTALLAKLLRPFRRDKVWRLRETQTDNGSSTRRVKIFIAPSIPNDRLTTTMANWLRTLAEEVQGVAALLIGPDASATALSAALTSHARVPVLVVFYGHGTKDALLTDVSLGYGAEALGGRYACLCKAADLRDAADLQLVAFSCAAGAGFGRDLSRLNCARTLGFSDEIGFVLGSSRREAAFSRPMAQAVKEICSSDVVDELVVRNLADAYAKERRRWMNGGEFARDTRSLVVAMFLNQHRKLIVME
jgi:hypothetical protein